MTVSERAWGGLNVLASCFSVVPEVNLLRVQLTVKARAVSPAALSCVAFHRGSTVELV
jgi:hypothetical protein